MITMILLLPVTLALSRPLKGKKSKTFHAKLFYFFHVVQPSKWQVCNQGNILFLKASDWRLQNLTYFFFCSRSSCFSFSSSSAAVFLFPDLPNWLSNSQGCENAAYFFPKYSLKIANILIVLQSILP
jgi:hypothetical protein